MRDPNRIKELLSLLKEIWGETPDLRFNQLIYNLQSEYSKNHNEFGLVEAVEIDGFAKTGFDFFLS
jgi:uncharacterized protein YihD (DUF1040 family)